MSPLNMKITQALKDLNMLSRKLLRQGYPEACCPIRKNAKFTVTFAKLVS